MHFARDGGTTHGLFLQLAFCAFASYAASTAFAQSCTTTEDGGAIMQVRGGSNVAEARFGIANFRPFSQAYFGEDGPPEFDDDNTEVPLCV